MVVSKRSRWAFGALSVSLALWTGACDDIVESEASVSLGAPLLASSGTTVALLSDALRSAVLFRPDGAAVLDAQVELPGQVLTWTPLSQNRIAVLTTDAEALTILDAATFRGRRVDLPSAFDAMTASGDGRWLVLSYAPGSSGAGDDILFNPNEIGLVDLQAPELAVRTLSLTGPRPERFVFAPPFSLGGEPLHYVVALGQSAVSFVDLLSTDPANVQRLVRLADPASGASFVPDSVVFTADDPTRTDDMTAFTIVRGASQLYAIDLLPADAESGRVLQPAVNLVALGGGIAGAASFVANGRQKLLVTTYSYSLDVVDVDTSQVRRVALSASPLNSAVTWTQVEDGAERPRALLWSPGASVVYFAELDQLEAQGAGALRARAVGGRVEQVLLSEVAPDTAVLTYQSGGGFGLLRLSTRTEVPIPSRVPLDGYAPVGNLVFASVPGDARLAVLDTTSDATGQVELPQPAQSMIPMGDSGVLAVSHGGDWLSFIRASDLETGVFAESRGSLLEGLLDGQERGGDQ